MKHPALVFVKEVECGIELIVGELPLPHHHGGLPLLNVKVAVLGQVSSIEYPLHLLLSCCPEILLKAIEQLLFGHSAIIFLIEVFEYGFSLLNALLVFCSV